MLGQPDRALLINDSFDDFDHHSIQPANRLERASEMGWVGPGRGRKSPPPGATGVVELTPFQFLDRLADLVPPPRKHRHRYHGVFAPNHRLRKAVTALAIGNVGKPGEAATGGHGGDGHATEGCCAVNHATHKPRSHDTSRIAWAHLGEPLEPPPASPARAPPTDWGELVQVHDDRDVFQASHDELPAIDINNL